MKKGFNPYLPSFEYVPDGEPHVFGDRIYIYGSHDRFRGTFFCLNDYVCYSASLDDLTDWRYEGVIYRKEDDPVNQMIPDDAPEQVIIPGIEPQGPEDVNPRGIHAMWAPDVVQGADGRFYLYYCLDFLPEIGVAVCDVPAGKYEYLGRVRYEDGTILGRKEGDLIPFDPGVFRDTDGKVYLFSGNAPMKPEEDNGEKGSLVMLLKEDMLTVAGRPKDLLPGVTQSEGTGFEGHEFFEASSIRKIGSRYYFVYSSVNSHELCYAVSEKPDEGYQYGGTLVDLADVYLEGRKEEEAVNALGNTHGGIECVNGQWYVFYHRQTNRTNFSRQGCAEKINMDPEGRFPQAEITSCGLHEGPLPGEGIYPAYICCHMTGNRPCVLSHPLEMKMDFPYLTQDVGDLEPTDERIEEDRHDPVQYITNIHQGCCVGYKYFLFEDTVGIGIKIRGNCRGKLHVSQAPKGKDLFTVDVESQSLEWKWIYGNGRIPDGKGALYFQYEGDGFFDLKQFEIIRQAGDGGFSDEAAVTANP